MQRAMIFAGAVVLAGLVAGTFALMPNASAPEQHVSAPPAGAGQGAPPPLETDEPVGGSGPPGGDPLPPPSDMPPAAGPGGEPRPEDLPPSTGDDTYTAGEAPGRPTAFPVKNGHSGSKVISYFQFSKTTIDARRAFGFVLLPKAAITESEKKVQKDFCETILATLDFLSPGAAGARSDVLATYWPIVATRGAYEITEAFTQRNCGDLLAWYDHALARKLALKAGVVELTGPLLITWPSAVGAGDEGRDPLIVDFSKANHERASKTLQYWFRQLKNRPELWTNRIREGTIRAELADAVNETAGVMLAVMTGKWESVTAVSGSP